MLRIIVISLVVVNLLLLGFQCSKPDVEAESRPAVAETRDAGIPTIHLFSEMMQDQGLLSGSRQCFTLGPFHSVEDRDDTYARLQEVSARISERQTEALVEKGYWVYMPPYATLLAANEALLSLQALGLKDVAIMYEGEWKNSISLGYFMRQENAQRRKKALEDRGFSPRMRIQRQAEPRYWLDYEQEPGSGLIALDMRNRPNDFMQRPVPCPEAEFLDPDALASQDDGLSIDEPQASFDETDVVSGQGEIPDQSQSAQLPAEIAEKPATGEQLTAAELPSGQEAGNAVEKTQDPAAEQADGDAADKTVVSPAANEPDAAPAKDAESENAQAESTGVDKPAETPADQVPGEATGDAVETVPVEDSVDTNDSGVESATVGEPADTGAADVGAAVKQAVGTGPEHIVAEQPQAAETAVPEQDAETPGAATSENKTDAGGETPAAAEQEPPGGTEKDSGNGTAEG